MVELRRKGMFVDNAVRIKFLIQSISIHDAWYRKRTKLGHSWVADESLRKMDERAKELAEITGFHNDCKN